MALIESLREPAFKNDPPADERQTALLHRRIIRNKHILRRVYADFYGRIAASLANGPGQGQIVEIGSGAGFLTEHLPGLITSDILALPDIDLRCSALQMPFRNNSLDGIVMVDVFHHLGDAQRFLREAERCLKPKGKVIMIEPANTAFSRFVYANFHHEVFAPEAGWQFTSYGPLSTANGALPWIVFERDREKFENLFPSFKLVQFQPHTPLSYLISGGLSYRQLVPNFLYPVIRGMERILSPFSKILGMFVTIELLKTG